jgi:hypothetical protein
VEYAVLLYPPVGVPRVIEVPKLPKGLKSPIKSFKTREKAEKALEEFLAANPEYRNWKDGQIVAGNGN